MQFFYSSKVLLVDDDPNFITHEFDVEVMNILILSMYNF